MQLHTPSLVLRPFTLDDAPAVFAMSREDGAKRWLPDQVCADEHEARELLAHLIHQYAEAGAPASAPFVLGLQERISGVLVGHVGLSPYKGLVEIGYGIGEARQGRGFATEAVHALSCWAVRRRDLTEVWGITDVDNVASARVLEKVGYALDRTEGGRHFYRFERR